MPFFFLNQALLAAAAMVGIPLAIHLINRRRAREDLLPTLRFLAAGYAANRRRLKTRHLVLLLVRMLAVLLVVLALARPAYRGALFFREGTAPVDAVIVMDNSLSMAYEEPTGRRFDRAKAIAGEIIHGLPPGSRVALVATGLGAKGEGLDREFTFNRTLVRDALMGLEVSAYGGTCTAGLAKAYALLGQERKGGQAGAPGELYVLGDMAAHAWQGLEGLSAPEDAATVVFDVSGDRDEDFHVDEVFAEPAAAPAAAIAVKASVASGDLAAKRLVTVDLGGAKRAERLIDLVPLSKQPVTFDVALAAGSAGPTQGWVSLADPDPMTANNTRYFTVAAAPPIKCAVVVRPVEQTSVDTGFYIRNALEPAALAGATFARVRYWDWREFKPSDLSGMDVLVLADVPDFPRELRDAVTAFGASGGGVIIFAGDAARAGDYDPFVREYFGASLGQKVDTAGGDGATVSGLSFDHAMLAAFAGGRNGNLAAARFRSWRRLEPVAASTAGAIELARTGSGDPLLLAGAIGEGRAVLAAFAPTREASDLPLRAPFVPLVNEMVRYAAGKKVSGAAQAGSADFPVGSAILFAVGRSSAQRQVEIVTPLAGKTVEVTIPPGAGAFTYRPFFPGNYLARIPAAGGPAQVAFSVNIPAEESALRRIAPKEITDKIRGSFVARDLSDRPLRRAWGRTRGAREFFDLVLVAAIVLLAVEECAANRFYAEAKP